MTLSPSDRLFPYDSVYFKAYSQPMIWVRVLRYFHTIPSILKPDSFRVHRFHLNRFPYDSVYFKARRSRERMGPRRQFPYDSVYFKALSLSILMILTYKIFPYDSVYFKA